MASGPARIGGAARIAVGEAHRVAETEIASAFDLGAGPLHRFGTRDAEVGDPEGLDDRPDLVEVGNGVESAHGSGLEEGDEVGAVDQVGDRAPNVATYGVVAGDDDHRAARRETVDLGADDVVGSDTGIDAAMAAVSIHGAAGYVSEFEVERDLRDAIGGLVYSGTSDIQRNIIARLMGVGQ